MTSTLETPSRPNVSYCRICPNINRLWSRESKMVGCQNFTLFTVLVRTCFLLRKKKIQFLLIVAHPYCVCVGGT